MTPLPLPSFSFSFTPLDTFFFALSAPEIKKEGLTYLVLESLPPVSAFSSWLSRLVMRLLKEMASWSLAESSALRAASSRSAVSARAEAASASARRFSSFYNRASVVAKEEESNKNAYVSGVVNLELAWEKCTRAFNGVALSTVFVLGSPPSMIARVL